MRRYGKGPNRIGLEAIYNTWMTPPKGVFVGTQALALKVHAEKVTAYNSDSRPSTELYSFHSGKTSVFNALNLRTLL